MSRMDGAFVESCVHQKLDILARLHDVLQGTVKPMITQCSMQQLYDKNEQTVIDAAKAFERRKCNHLKAKPESECLKSMTGSDNVNRYVIATQSLDLRKTLRAVPGLPLVYISRSVMLLESPSDQTLAKKIRMEREKLHVPASEMALLKGQAVPSGSNHIIGADVSDASAEREPVETVGVDMQGEVVGEPTSIEQPQKKKRKGPKGPNPLSVKKKSKSDSNTAPGSTSKKRSRDDDGSASRQDQVELKRKRVENENVKVSSLAKRGEERQGDQARKKRKRSKKKKGGEQGEAGGEAAAD
ncbi:hypothetical protein OIV83_003225 [Microbotryomycetes sp. JL201]|nr:hypothetical protein OIV83_003225 [Microbotryomycetes sp. JL201]